MNNKTTKSININFHKNELDQANLISDTDCACLMILWFKKYEPFQHLICAPLLGFMHFHDS